MGISSLSALVAAVRAIDPDEYGPPNIGRMLVELQLSPSEVAPYVLFEPDRYTRNLIFRNANFEVLILCWAAGVASPVHDHAGQRCWFSAIEGAFDVDEYRRLSGGRHEGYARLEQTGTLLGIRTGQPDYRYGENDIHRVATAANQGPAVSLHVYARPFSTCLVYDCERDRCMRRELSYDTVGLMLA